MRVTFAAGRRDAARFTLAAAALAAGLAAAGQAAAGNNFPPSPPVSDNFVSATNGGDLHGQADLNSRTGDTEAVAQVVANPDGVAQTVAAQARASAAPGHLSTSVSADALHTVTNTPVPLGLTSTLTSLAQVSDGILIQGTDDQIGQVVTLHKLLTVTGSHALDAILHSNGARFSGDIDLDFQSTGTLTADDGTADFTHVHAEGLLFPNINDTFEFTGDRVPLTFDFAQDVVIGEETTFGLGLRLQMVLNGDPLVDPRSPLRGNAAFDVTWDTGGFFTDTTGHLVHKLSVTSDSGFNFFGHDTGVPEPATWALFLCGFGIMGGALRWRPARAGSHP